MALKYISSGYLLPPCDIGSDDVVAEEINISDIDDRSKDLAPLEGAEGWWAELQNRNE